MPDLKRNVPQFFFDDQWIGYQHKLVRRWLPAKTNPWPVISPDRPWEKPMITLYGTVLPHPQDGFRLYYCNWVPGFGHAHNMVATSRDGVTWTRPNLGLVEHEGSRDNNILPGIEKGTDSPSVVFDPDDAANPYKMLACWDHEWGLHGFLSPDGLRWTKIPGRRLRAGDVTNLVSEKVDGQFVAYTRHANMNSLIGCRGIYRTQSENFMDWSEPELAIKPDLVDAPDVEYYGMSVFRRHDWHLGLLWYWRSADEVIELYLVYSRDGKTWHHPEPRKPFIAAEYDWNRRWSSAASNGPIVVKEQLVFYFGGRWVGHTYDSAHQVSAIGYSSIPLDRFCAIEGVIGRLDTPTFTWPGGELVLNADCRGVGFEGHPQHLDGSIGVEVLDESGAGIAGFSGADKGQFKGNTHARGKILDGTVMFPNGRKTSELAGKNLRLRFFINHARLFTFEAR